MAGDGRARYARARARALARTGDPQSARRAGPDGGPPAAAPCQDGRCADELLGRHRAIAHTLPDGPGAARRGRCTVAGPAGPCPCPRFRLRFTAPSGGET